VQEVAGKDVTACGYDEQLAILKNNLRGLPEAPAPKIEIVFDTGSVEKTIVFSKRPLGFTFQMAAPIEIKSVAEDSVASLQGVGVGWTIKRVDGEDMKEVPAKEQHEILKTRVGWLPEVSARVAPPAAFACTNQRCGGSFTSSGVQDHRIHLI